MAMGRKKKPDQVSLYPRDELVQIRYSTKKLTQIYLMVATVFVLLFLAIYFFWFSSIVYAMEKNQFIAYTNETRNSDDTDQYEHKILNSPACYDVPETEKFDCYPEPDSNEEGCHNRGCCWFKTKPDRSDVNQTRLGVPYCFYPYDYNGYQLQNTKHTPNGVALFLKRVTPSGFPNDIEEIVVNATFINNEQLRIKVYDAKMKRYEVLVPSLDSHHLITNYGGQEEERKYRVDTDQKSIWITRLSNGKVIFHMQLSQLIFANQMIQVSIKLPSHFVYGIGDTKSPLMKSTDWTRYVLFARDRSPVEDMNLYSSHPFYLVMEDSDLESAGNSHGVLLLNSNAMEVVLQPTPAITFRSIGGIVDLLINVGPDPNKVISQHTRMVGYSFMPPYWSLGFHLCRFGYKTLNRTREIMNQNIAAGIPLDVQWNDLDYMLNRNDFSLDKETFGELPQFVKQLHDKGMHYMFIIDPGISASEPPGTYQPYEDGIQMDIFIKNATGQLLIGKVWNKQSTVFPDFTNPKTIRYWTKQFKDFHDVVPFDGAWTDMNEPSNFLDGSVEGCPKDSELDNPPFIPGNIEPLYTKTICMSAQQYSSVHYNIHNIYGLTETIATNIALTDTCQKRPFIISRSTFPGHGHYGGCWDGDIYSSWDQMRWSISSILSLNMYGISMSGADICGFNDNTTSELCARWSALGAFYPFSRNHNSDDTIDQDPVSLGPDVVSAAKSALQTRYFLLPYMYTLFYHSHIEGQTVARPLFFEFPKDKVTYSIDTQFLLGPAMMVIPVLQQGVIEVTGYLPSGTWYHMSNGTQYKATGEMVTFPAPIDTINILLRGGYIIPGQEHGATTTESRLKRFTILVLLEDGVANGDLYWDDGDSIEAYDMGTYNLVQFSSSDNVFKSSCVKAGFKTEMTLGTVVFYGVNVEPVNVTLNGNKANFLYDKQAQVLHCVDLNVTLLNDLTLSWK